MRDLGRVGRYRFQRSSWYDYSWDWALASIFALVLLAGAVFLARITGAYERLRLSVAVQKSA